MGKFNSAEIIGTGEKQIITKHNDLLKLLDEGYLTEGIIDGNKIRVEINPKVGLAFYQDNTYRGGLEIVEGSLSLVTDIVKDVDDDNSYFILESGTTTHGKNATVIDFYAANKQTSPTGAQNYMSMWGWSEEDYDGSGNVLTYSQMIVESGANNKGILSFAATNAPGDDDISYMTVVSGSDTLATEPYAQMYTHGTGDHYTLLEVDHDNISIVSFDEADNSYGYLQITSDYVFLAADNGSSVANGLYITPTAVQTYDGSSYYDVWHEGNFDPTDYVGKTGRRFGTDGSSISGTGLLNSVNAEIVDASDSNFPTTYGSAWTFDIIDEARAFSLFKDRASENLYLQTFDADGAGDGWKRIYTDENINVKMQAGESTSSSSSGGNVTVTFPVAFPAGTIPRVTMQAKQLGTSNTPRVQDSPTNTGFVWDMVGTSIPCDWIAVIP